MHSPISCCHSNWATAPFGLQSATKGKENKKNDKVKDVSLSATDRKVYSQYLMFSSEVQ